MVATGLYPSLSVDGIQNSISRGGIRRGEHTVCCVVGVGFAVGIAVNDPTLLFQTVCLVVELFNALNQLVRTVKLTAPNQTTQGIVPESAEGQFCVLSRKRKQFSHLTHRSLVNSTEYPNFFGQDREPSPVLRSKLRLETEGIKS